MPRRHPKGTLVRVVASYRYQANLNPVGWIVRMCPCGVCSDAQVEQTAHGQPPQRRWLPASDYRVVTDNANFPIAA